MNLRARLARAIAPPRPAPEERGGLPWDALYPSGPPPAFLAPIVEPAPVRRVLSAIAPVTLALANPHRSSLTIVNDSTATLYVKHGPGVSSVAGGYTVALGAGATYVLESPDIYQGELSGVWSAVNGAASITETR